MKKHLKKLLKNLQIFAGFNNKSEAANFLLICFSDNKIFDLPEYKQKKILDNLLNSFDLLFTDLKTEKRKKSNYVTTKEIKQYIKDSVIRLNNLPLYKY